MPIPAPGFQPALPKILIPEKISPDGIEILKKSTTIHQKHGLSPEELLRIIPDYDALIVRSETKVTAELLRAGKKLKVVARAGVGVDNVDVATATTLGVIVVNSPVGNINAAAEHTIALMMAVARNVGDACASLKAGKWERSRLVGVEVKGKTLAIVGLGKVGLTVARQAGGLGMNLIAYDPYANPNIAAAANVTLYPSIKDLLPLADFFTIHTPLIASTKGMIGAAELAIMKPTARLLNVARGGMIDEAALLSALSAQTIAGAGLDVFTSEPPQPDSVTSRLIAHPAVVATPHLGASTVEAQENVSLDVCEQVILILAGQLPRSAVNAPFILPEEYGTLKPFVGLVEKMGTLYTQHCARYRRDGLPGTNAHFRTTFDLIYEGALANLNTTKPLFAALVKGLLATIAGPDGTNVNIVNAELVAKERGITINESRSRENVDEKGYAASVTLKARLSRSSGASADATEEEQEIQGFVSANTPYIRTLDRFSTNFVPAGTLLICRNFDSVGKIGFVGSRLGKAGVNIRYMSVAPLRTGGKTFEGNGGVESENEALMILEVDRPVEDAVVKGLIGEEGVLEASVVTL
ncbi:phosphoglycerate dehydrogenase [Eremomyces bilateralis CBS 781.70]|uniref:D-3-phosphoglycerate dehydrogenase n=1 Tax=Eremomyces bilateralis CBS 781.70 TaxID=1392243 RepID=A0A6G1FVI8_9PEZI|nr:phosphoglycerate dehydrogenase [Eremomyces bilateralis CBS 781.70]KAF1809730.1 phosphoglycerate dehydrogenase [Eremomyces bilateralis CBS 781.70]